MISFCAFYKGLAVKRGDELLEEKSDTLAASMEKQSREENEKKRI